MSKHARQTATEAEAQVLPPSGIPNASLVVFGVAVAVLAIHAGRYLPFMADDAFISLRYADRFRHGHGLTWNDGEAVEGYSNLLWILGCALLSRFGLDLVVAARVLGFLGGVAAIAAVVWAHRAAALSGVLPGLAGALALACSGSLAIWTIGGLEQPLLAGLLAWALALGYPLLEAPASGFRSVLGPGLLLGLICLTRPDGALFTAAACLGLLAARGLDRPALRDAVRLAAVPVLFYMGQLAFRLAYYHDWFPNPAFAKVGFTGHRIWTGFRYLGGGVYLSGLAALSLLAFFTGARDPRHLRRVRFLVVVLLLWAAYVFVIGGDIFPGRRHLLPAVVIMAFLAALSVAAWNRSRGAASAALIAGLCLVLFGAVQLRDRANQRAIDERWEWDGKAIAQVLARGFGAQRPLLALDAAGALAFFSRLPAVDMLGLNDHYLAHHRPAGFGTGALAHELGNGAYVLSRRPDLVMFGGTGDLEPSFHSGLEMVRDPSFYSSFRPVVFECGTPGAVRPLVWARVEDGAIGIRRTMDQVVVPGFLLGTTPHAVEQIDSDRRLGVAALDASGRLGVELTPGGLPDSLAFALAPGRWKVRIESSGAPVSAHLGLPGTAGPLDGRDSIGFTMPGTADRLSLGVTTAGPGAAHVRAVVFQRLGENQTRAGR